MSWESINPAVVYDVIPDREGWMVVGPHNLGLHPVFGTLRSAIDKIRQVTEGNIVSCHIRIHNEDGGVELDVHGFSPALTTMRPVTVAEGARVNS